MKLIFESVPQGMKLVRNKCFSPYSMDYIDVYEYRDVDIECDPALDFPYMISYCGDDILFNSLEEAKDFIDQEYVVGNIDCDWDKPMNESFSKNDVINAIVWNDGCSKAEAQRKYKNMDDKTRQAYADLLKDQAKKSFYND